MCHTVFIPFINEKQTYQILDYRGEQRPRTNGRCGRLFPSLPRQGTAFEAYAGGRRYSLLLFQTLFWKRRQMPSLHGYWQSERRGSLCLSDE